MRSSPVQRGGLCLALMWCGWSAVPFAQQLPKADTPQALSVGIVIDAHRQPQNVTEFERRVVEALAGALTSVAREAFAISYSDSVRLVADWAPPASLSKGAAERFLVGGAQAAGRGSVLNDGLMEGLTKLGSTAGGGRKVLIVIGEGNDEGSTATSSQALAAARSQHIPCFVLLVAQHRAQVGRVRQFGFDLYRLASGTGGKAYDVRTRPQALDEALQDVLKRLAPPLQT